MTKLDIAILILVGLAGVSCYRAGFTQSVWGLFVIGVSLFAASHFGHHLRHLVQKFIADPAWAHWLSVAVVGIIVAIIVNSLFEQVEAILKRGVLGWANDLLGLCFGIASAAVFIGFLLMVLSTYGSDAVKNEIANSQLAPRLTTIGHRVWAVSQQQVQHLHTE